MTILETVKKYIYLMEQSRLESWVRTTQHTQGNKAPKVCNAPTYRELSDLLKNIVKEYDIEFIVPKSLPVCGCGVRLINEKCYFYGLPWHDELIRKPLPEFKGYTKEQHITDLQTRNTELVEANRKLKDGIKTAISVIKTSTERLTNLTK